MKKFLCHIEDSYISWRLYEDNTNIVNYTFRSKKEGSYVGKKLVFITLLRFAILDCLGIERVYIDQELTEYEIKYIDSEIDNMIEYSSNNHNLKIVKPVIQYRNIIKEDVINTVKLDRSKCYIGYSGGKDSKLCYDLIKDSFKDIVKFKIDFDNEEFNNEYHESIEVVDKKLYELVSAKELYEKNGKRYYQEEDLHCCFSAPFFSVAEDSPAYLCVGLQYDVSNYYVYNGIGNLIAEFDLMETYNSIKKFEGMLRYYGLKDFVIFVPLASATSFAIYNILRNKYGDIRLRAMNSCWFPDEKNEPCGKCLKCQRVSYIYNILGMDLTNKEKSSLKLFEDSGYDLDYLFGSISCMQLINKYYKNDLSKLKNIIFIDEKIAELDLGFSEKLSNSFSMSIVENPLKKKL